MNKKELAASYRGLLSAACRMFNLFGCRKKIRGKGNQIQIPCSLVKHTKIRIFGDDNMITAGDFSQLTGVSIEIHGSGNRIHLGSWGTYTGTEIYAEYDHNRITVGDRAHFYGKVQLAAMEGTSITVGEDCLCSSNIEIRTGDSHAVLNMEGRRINPSRDVSVGEHVWIGKNVMILKGSEIGPHCIVGAGALVSGAFPDRNCSIAGVPARILRREVDWSVHHIPVGDMAPDFVPSDEKN